MLNTFPGLLYPFFAPLILRALVGLVFLYIAYGQYRHREKISALNILIVGKSFTALAIIFHVLVGGMLLFGYYTQIAAILAIIGLFKGWWLNRRYPSVVILPSSTIVVVIVICLSLLVSGAGALAQDLPL
jgi:uncharacterized membrane protein YphA (DoxX/SURF4 family)